MNDDNKIEQFARDHALLFLKRLGRHASRVTLSVEDLSELWRCSPGFLREVISMGCPSANNKLSAAAVFEWMKENCGQFRSQTGLPELPAIAIDPQDLELAEAWNALRTIVEYHQTRWTDAARKAQLVGIIDAFGELFPSAGTDADKLLLRLVFRELSLIPADINRNG